MDLIEHPRPQLRRSSFTLLDGEWQFADDPGARWRRPAEVEWSATIQVPFAPETPASGIGTTDYRKACWYRSQQVLTAPGDGGRLVLHFNAVDHKATVWVDGARVGGHEGGYTPFSVDLTDYADGNPHDIVVRAEDDPLDLAKPRGKQDWEREAHAIWYPRTTGIWQSVWLEQLPEVSVQRLHWTPDLHRCALRMTASVDGTAPEGSRLRVRLSHEGRVLVDDSVLLGTSSGGAVERDFVLDTTGLETMRERLMWRPDRPSLIDAVVEVVAPDGRVVDRVESYAGLREVGVRGGRLILNGRPLRHRLVLDQGYWPETGLSAPDEAALRRDVELAKAMGFNGVRKHQKVEDPRYLYWADRLGLMVWAELPAAYTGGDVAMRRAVAEWTEVIERDRSHPCIVMWVPFNESWGLLSLEDQQRTRDYVKGVAALTKALDPTRTVVPNDGWESLGGDAVGVHDYDPDAEALGQRYDPAHLAETLRNFAESGRLLVVGEATPEGLGNRALVISEFGGLGIRTADADDVWSYSQARDGDELVERYAALVAALLKSPRVSGFCYTQFADTYQEANGLLHADRTPKAPLEAIARATRGPAQRPSVAELAPVTPPLPPQQTRRTGPNAAAPAPGPVAR